MALYHDWLYLITRKAHANPLLYDYLLKDVIWSVADAIYRRAWQRKAWILAIQRLNYDVGTLSGDATSLVTIFLQVIS